MARHTLEGYREDDREGPIVLSLVVRSGRWLCKGACVFQLSFVYSGLQ